MNSNLLSSPTRRPWYKKTGGILLLVLLGIIGFIFLIFLFFFVYDLWQIKSGHIADLENEFHSTRFTAGTGFAVGTGLDKTPAEVASVIRGTDPTIGSSKAPVTIVAFVDFQCPFCQAGYPLFHRVMDKYQPVARVVFKNFPLETIHPDALAAANAAACANAQGKFWPYYDQLFTVKALDQDSFIRYAQATKLNLTKFTACLSAATYQSSIDQDLQDGIVLGVRGTPTYFVNGTRIEGVTNEATWDKAIIPSLKK